MLLWELTVEIWKVFFFLTSNCVFFVQIKTVLIQVASSKKNVSKVSLGISTVESNQDQERDFLRHWNKLLKSVKIFLTAETGF